MTTDRRAPIRIGIIDDHPVYRLGLKRALERETDLAITWEMGSTADLNAVMSKTPVDVLLLDVYLGTGKDGLAATREVAERWPDLKVVSISASLDVRIGPASERAGARLFLQKAMPIADMVSSIKRVALAGSTRSNTGLRSARRRPGATGRTRGLSPRQLEVLEDLRIGRTNREIAARLGVSVGTVNKHVHEVLAVLKVRNRTQAAAAFPKDVTD